MDVRARAEHGAGGRGEGWRFYSPKQLASTYGFQCVPNRSCLDISSIKTKMLYASTKEYFRDCLDGTGIEIQATDISEIDADSMYDRVRTVMTRK